MVNKFGDSSFASLDFFENLQVVRKVVVTKGKYSDYHNEIQTSIKLGFTPYRISPENGSLTQLYVFENEVWCLGSVGKAVELVSKETITTASNLVYWKEGDIEDGDDAIAIKGDKGSRGEKGSRGNAGPSGARGEQGTVGRQGEKGATGGKGQRGGRGERGTTGKRGADGVQGPAGKIGKMGSPGPQGPVGKEGKCGPPGPQGVQGQHGDRGEKGNNGTKGDTGPAGERGPAGSTGHTGPVGPTGAGGTVGPSGPTGPAGERGPQGAVGSSGAVGPAGPTGPTGERGAQGPVGPVMKLLVRYVGPELAQNFRIHQVMLWYNAASQRNIYLHAHDKIGQMYNLTRYKWYADRFPLKLPSPAHQKATFVSESFEGHMVVHEDKKMWNTETGTYKSLTSMQRHSMKFHSSRYVNTFPFATEDTVCVFIVYRLDSFLNSGVEENYLISSTPGKGQRGICFTPAKFAGSGKTSIRIHGVDSKHEYFEFANWGQLPDPTKVGLWNVICVHWNGTKKNGSSLWVNYCRDRLHSFTAADSNVGRGMTIGDTSSDEGLKYLDGALKNIEVYDSDFVDDFFITAHMKYLSDYYGVQNNIYK